MEHNQRIVHHFLTKEIEKLENMTKEEIHSTLTLLFWAYNNSNKENYLKHFNRFLKIFNFEAEFMEKNKIFSVNGGRDFEYVKLLKLAAFINLVGYFAECHTREEEEKIKKNNP